MVSDEKLFRIAIAYYRNGKTQTDLAAEFGVSHVQVGKYLKLAKKRGIVEITINAPFVDQNEQQMCSIYLKEAFGLEKLVLVPSASDPRRSMQFLVDGACDYLINSFTNKSLNVGVGMGKTMSEISHFRTRSMDRKTNWTIYPVTNYIIDHSMRHDSGSYYSYLELPQNFQDNWGSRKDDAFIDSVRDDKGNDVSSIWKCLDVIIGGVGVPLSRDPEVRRAILGESYSSSDDIPGDYINYFFDSDGHILNPKSPSRYAIDLDTIRSVKSRIAVASGFQKVYSIIGLLKCDLINTLITDITTARNIVEVLK